MTLKTWEMNIKSYKEVNDIKSIIDDTVRYAILTDNVTKKQEILKGELGMLQLFINKTKIIKS